MSQGGPMSRKLCTRPNFVLFCNLDARYEVKMVLQARSCAKDNFHKNMNVACYIVKMVLQARNFAKKNLHFR